MIKDGARLRGHFIVEQTRPYDRELARRIRLSLGKDSPEYKALPRYVVGISECHNIITDEGLDRMLDVMLHGTTQTATWYCAIFESDTTPDGSETYDVPVYTESTAYDEATRPAYNEAASSSQSITNSANKAVFTISGSKTIYGAALVSVNTKGDHTGGADNVLFCCGKFTLARVVVDDDVLNLTYTVTAADDGV
jgi:hypothetical protein